MAILSPPPSYSRNGIAMTKKLQLTALALVSMNLSFASMAADVPTGTKLASEQHLVRGNGAEPSSLDPSFVNSGMPDDIIANDMFEGLLIENGQGQLIPGQAIDWSVSEDGKKFTFTLRDDLVWSNGAPVLASDFVFAWQRAVNPNTGNNTGHYFVTANLVNAKEIQNNKAAVTDLGVKALDAKTLQVTLTKPTPYFLNMMTIKTFSPLPAAVVEQHGKTWSRAETIVTNGPYKLAKWLANEYVEVQRNPQYWDNANTVINKVTYLGLESQIAEWNRYQAGEIDMTNRVQLEYYQSMMTEHPEQIKSQALLGTYLYSFNTRKAPFDNKLVRQALSMAVDRDILVNKITAQGEPAAYSIVPQTIANYTTSKPDFAQKSQQQRVELAKALLAKAGYNKQNPLKFTLTYNTSENHKKIALVIASMWKPLGVNVILENMEWKSYVAAKNMGDFQLARSWAFGDYAEPSALLEAFTCDNPVNESGFCEPKFDTLLATASNTADENQRYGLYQQAEAILSQSAPMMPLYNYTQTRMVRETLKGFPENNPRGNIYAKDMYFVK